MSCRCGRLNEGDRIQFSVGRERPLRFFAIRLFLFVFPIIIPIFIPPTIIMEKEIAESLARLRQIGEQVGLASSSSSAHESESENPVDFSERIIFSDIQQLKDVGASRPVNGR